MLREYKLNCVNLFALFNSRFQLLVLDDFGVLQISTDDATNLFEIIEDRAEINSTIITSQLPVSQW